MRVLLDLHAAHAEDDHLEVRRERRWRDREDAVLVRVLEQRAGLSASELVIDGLDGDVHEREVVGSLRRADVFRRNRADVVLDVSRKRLLVQLALGVAPRLYDPVVFAEWKL